MSETLSQLRRRADFDRNLTHGACRLLSCVINERYYKSPTQEFALPWTKAHKWLGLSKDQCYRLIGELLKKGYLKSEGLRGCPPTHYFVFVLKGRKNAAIEVGKKAAINCPKNAPNHKYNSLREESLKKEGALVPLSVALAAAREAVEKGG